MVAEPSVRCESSVGHMISCSFSPGRMPITLMRQLRRHRLGEIDDAHRRDLRHEDLAAVHALEALEDEIDALLEA